VKLQIHTAMSEIDPAAWDAIAGPQPFLQHAFLHLLETTGCVGEDAGWLPCHAALRDDGGQLRAAMPLYLKTHSWGEYVFDWAWADASQRADIAYYPKLLCAIPFTPVPGARLLGHDDDARRALLAGVLRWVDDQGLSGLHCLFPPMTDAPLFEAAGLMQRRGVQFHWHNRGYAGFDDFIGTMSHDKRKKIKQERRKVGEAGVQITRKTGAAITEADWRFFSACYDRTYAAHRSTPYLNLDFFLQLGEAMGDQCLLVLAEQAGQPIAAALNLFDATRLYGRYWGAMQFVPSLHFELCYYQGIEFAIERGLQVFEGGAQGEHKLARGFEAEATCSFHRLSHPGLHEAVQRFLLREGHGVAHYLSELDERAPFRE